jgi:hypothetical protein
MNMLVIYRVTPFIALIEQAGVPALRIAFTIAVIIFLIGGILIFRSRHRVFDRDPNVENDVPVVRLGRSDAGLDCHLVPSLAGMTKTNLKSPTQVQKPRKK